MTNKKARSVKHWPEDEQPRESPVAHGPVSHSDAQLLAIIAKNRKAGRIALDLAWCTWKDFFYCVLRDMKN